MDVRRVREFAGPAARCVVRLYAAWRLDWAIGIGCAGLAGPIAGSALHKVVRMLMAAKAARDAADNSGAEHSNREPQSSSEPAAPALEAAAVRAAEPAAPQRQPTAAASRRSKQLRKLPAKTAKGLPPLPALPLPAGGHGCCSTQPVGLPLMLVSQSAARAPLYAWGGSRRLLRGLGGLGAMLICCGLVRTPFTGRRAWLPPRLVERLYHTIMGPVAAVSYLSATMPSQSSSLADRAACERFTPLLSQLYTRLRASGERAAEALGRGVVFASSGAAIEAVQRQDVNACCLPGGIVFVHSGLIKAVDGDPGSLAFVVGHEVGHAIGRHSLEKATVQYAGLFAIDVIVGLAEMLMRGGRRAGPQPPTASSSSLYSLASAAGDEGESRSADPLSTRLRALDGALQTALYVAQLSQSRQHEYEADALALHLGSGAGMRRYDLAEGAMDVLHKFMRMEAGGAGVTSGPVPDNPLSTHPAAFNRLQRMAHLTA